MKPSKSLLLVCLVLVAGSGCHRRPTRAAQVKRGDELYAQKKYVDATKAYYAAALNGPADAQLLQKVVDIDLEGGSLTLARDAATRLSDIEPNDVKLQVQAVRLMLSWRMYDDVLHRLAKVAADNPQNTAVLTALAN